VSILFLSTAPILSQCGREDELDLLLICNGVVTFVRETSSVTKQYQCQIEHAFRVKVPCERCPNFVDYGDAERYRERSTSLRN